MAKYKTYRDQFVVAHIADFDHTNEVISYGVQLARIINKGLILLHISDPSFTTLTPDEAAPRLQALQRSVQQGTLLDAPYQPVTYAALKGDTATIVKALPDLVSAIVAVVAVDAKASRRSMLHPRTLLRCYRECRVAYLTVQQPLPAHIHLRQVALSIDYSKESKQKMMWASYFARFNGSTVHALHYDYTDSGLRYKCESNLRFMQQFFTSVDASFQAQSIVGNRAFIDLESLRYCDSHHYELLIAITTYAKDVLEWFVGTQERRTIVNPYHIPILFLNPREDVYVLCD